MGLRTHPPPGLGTPDGGASAGYPSHDTVSAIKASLLALLVTSAGPARAEGWGEAAKPVYRGVEAVSDRVYGLMRGHLFTAVLPGRLTRHMGAVPAKSSEALFVERLDRRQERAARRILDSRPGAAQAGPSAMNAWRDSALREQTAVLTDALADALIGRYELERFGRASGDYATNRGNWDPEFLASATVLGGAYMWAAGLRTDWTLWGLRVDFDTVTGAGLRAAADGEGRLGEVALSRKGSPLALRTEWSLRDGRLANSRVGLTWASRF